MKNTLNLFFKYWKKYKSKKRFELLSYLQYLFSRVRIGFKHPSFANEQEVRLVVELTEEQFFNNLSISPIQKEVKIRVVNNTFVPYLEIPFFDEKTVKRVTASPIIKDEKALDSLYLLLYKYGYYNTCEVWSSDIPLKY